MIPVIDLLAQYRTIQSEVDAAVRSVFESGQFIGGTLVEKFESEFAARLGVQHCIGVANGTDALLITLKALGVGAGDKVIVPAFGWISGSEMVTLAGASPVFADVLPSGVIDPSAIEALITPETKGVIAIHLYGQAASVRLIKKICDRHGIFLLEDCAQAHLTAEHDELVGAIGTAGTFSFYPTKNLGAYGDAGAIVTRDESLAATMRLYANHGGISTHRMEGINSRLDTLQAAVLTVKLRHLNSWTDRRIANAAIYFSELRGMHELALPEVRPETRHTFHQFVVRSRHRNALKLFLAGQGIQTAVHYPNALHNLPAYRYLNHSESDFPEATRCQEEVLSLPVYPELSENQISTVCTGIKQFFNGRS